MQSNRPVIVALCAMLAACNQAQPSATTPGATSGPAATVAGPSASEVPTATEAALRAEHMRLVGSVPGSDGDLAIWGDLAVVAHLEDWRKAGPDDGFVVIDVSDPAAPTELGRFRCVASDADISIWENLVFLSQYEASASEDCGSATGPDQVSGAFAGVRVVSIEDPANPVQLAAVRTGVAEGSLQPAVKGSHTNTIVPDLQHVDARGKAAPRLLVYANMYYHPGVHPHVSIVEVPLGDPAAARVIGAIDNSTTLGCHDTTVFLPRSLMACAAYEAGVILFDITDPEHPAIVGHFINPTITKYNESHHSTAFSNDGKTLVVNAEIYTDVGVAPCSGGSGQPRGALWFYDISDPANPVQRGSFQLPRATRGHACYPHESNVIPMTGDRDVAITGWFGGGVNAIDFTDPTNPQEIAYWVSAAAEGEHSFPWAAYWYNGYIYAGNTALGGIDEPPSNRGLDIFALDDGLVTDAVELPWLNAQTQPILPGS
jgi:hypothetical protein